MTFSATPLLKWPGGKRRVIPSLTPYFPEQYSAYYEPFLGGGAVFFHIQPHNAHLSDINEELINVYQTVKTHPEELITELSSPEYINTEINFYHIRGWDREENFTHKTHIQRAARTLYLNKTCFNGLYRLNSKGQFNTPYGKYSNPTILNIHNIRESSKMFNELNTTFTTHSYTTALENLPKNSFIYLDPPYIPLTPTASFVGYSKEGFTAANHQHLAQLAAKLKEHHTVLISNSDTPTTKKIYHQFTPSSITVARSVGAAAATRTKAPELILH